MPTVEKMGSSSVRLRVSNRRSLTKVDDPLLDDFASAAVEQVVPGAAEGVLQPGEGGDGHAGFAFLEAPDGAVVQRRPRNVILNEKF